MLTECIYFYTGLWYNFGQFIWLFYKGLNVYPRGLLHLGLHFPLGFSETGSDLHFISVRSG